MRQEGAAFHGLHVLLDDDPRWPRDPVAQARSACAGGAQVLQLRVKNATDRQTLAWGEVIRRLSREARATFVVNDRFDLALACGADAVHLGQDDLPPDALPDDALRRLAVGRSTHDLEQARASRDEPIDYVAFGPVFGTRSKESPYEARGLPMLEAVCRVVAPRPVVAIGGIDASNVAALIEAGAAGVAVISAVAGARDPEAATRTLATAAAAPAPGRRQGSA